MKETDKKEINVFFRHKIVKENLSVAGVNGYISTACESSRYDGGAVSWNACSDPTPGSVNHHMQADRNSNCISLHPYYNANSIQLLPPLLIAIVTIYLYFIFKHYSISRFPALNSSNQVRIRYLKFRYST
jgi:hypothetical protein